MIDCSIERYLIKFIPAKGPRLKGQIKACQINNLNGGCPCTNLLLCPLQYLNAKVDKTKK